MQLQYITATICSPWAHFAYCTDKDSLCNIAYDGHILTWNVSNCRSIKNYRIAGNVRGLKFLWNSFANILWILFSHYQ